MYPNEELRKKLEKDQAKAAELYPFEPGTFYLGTAINKRGHDVEIGIPSKRHALTIAGARSGKGVGVIIPNLLRWPHNAIVIDPKGEAAEATAEKREAMGQAVHVLDPFHVADVPERFRARFNPLQNLDPTGRTIREDINVITDGLVMRHDPRAGHWDGGAASLIAGVIAQVVDTAPPELRTLPEMRKLLTMPDAAFKALIEEMSTNGAVGNLPASAAARLLRSGTEAPHFISNADENTKWLDSTPIAEVLTDSTFDLADLKTKPTTVYLVLPAHLLNEHGRFLRLFVRSAINAMAKGGTKGGHQTLFMLDEFFSLGRIDEIAKSSGLMPGYGVRLWPILQDLSQLSSLYGQEAGTFFANADVHQFFGNADKETLDYVSHRIGANSLNDIPLPPGAYVPANTNIGGAISSYSANSKQSYDRMTGAVVGGTISVFGAAIAAAEQAAHQDAMNKYHREMSKLGKPRIPPDDVAALVQLKSDVVADGTINFVYGSECYYLHLAPYFRPSVTNQTSEHRAPQKGLATVIPTALSRWFSAHGIALGSGALWGAIISGIVLSIQYSSLPASSMSAAIIRLSWPVSVLFWAVIGSIIGVTTSMIVGFFRKDRKPASDSSAEYVTPNESEQS